jgi:hypothetical protein
MIFYNSHLQNNPFFYYGVVWGAVSMTITAWFWPDVIILCIVFHEILMMTLSLFASCMSWRRFTRMRSRELIDDWSIAARGLLSGRLDLAGVIFVGKEGSGLFQPLCGWAIGDWSAGGGPSHLPVSMLMSGLLLISRSCRSWSPLGGEGFHGDRPRAFDTP